MTTAYALTIDLPQPLPTAIETLRAALAAEQMGIVSEVDVQATLKAKLGLDSHPQKLLGICSPKVAHAILSAEPDMGAMLPCGCGVSAIPIERRRLQRLGDLPERHEGDHQVLIDGAVSAKLLHKRVVAVFTSSVRHMVVVWNATNKGF